MTATKPTVGQALRGLKRQALAARPAPEAQPNAIERLLGRKPKAPKMAKLRPVHLLPRVPLFAALPSRSLSFDRVNPERDTAGLGVKEQTIVVSRPGRAVVSGWQEAQRRIEKATGAYVRLAPSGRPYLVSANGRVPSPTPDVFSGPVVGWIAAGLRGEPLTCDWCNREAVGLLVGGVPVCGEHG